SDWSPTGYLTRKHQQPFSEIPISLKGDASINYVAIRYADVLLWYAEALNELGNSSQALGPLNEVRKRARESHLYFDLIRYGQAYAEQALADKSNFSYALNKYFPIPQSERDRNHALH